MKAQQASELLKKYKEGSITDEELAVLEGWYNRQAEKGRVDMAEEEIHAQTDAIWTSLQKSTTPSRIKKMWPLRAAVASLLILSGLGIYIVSKKSGNETGNMLAKTEIVPGGNRAYLTLSNGKKIELNEASNGQLASEAGVMISKAADGEIIYQILESEVGGKNAGSNTIETPKGGQYRLTLPDGTKIWLNAASSITYPLRFSDRERVVKLVGEGYFEVEKDARRPFRVKTSQQELTVLGTRFNISGYQDDAYEKTTLVEGSVRISNLSSKKHFILKPQEQATLRASETSINTVPADEAIAWKNGEFIFSDEPLESIMKKISRWYNLEVKFEGINTAERFGGSVSKFEHVSKVLEKLELTGGIQFKIDKRTIIVTN